MQKLPNVLLQSAQMCQLFRIGYLNREIQKKARHKPLRILFLKFEASAKDQAMSADESDSVAQIWLQTTRLLILSYLTKLHRFRFGMQYVLLHAAKIYRCRDPKQLPPTSFFGRSESQEWEESELIEDMESIPDDSLAWVFPVCICAGITVPARKLITFSNAK